MRKHDNHLIFEKSSPGRRGWSVHIEVLPENISVPKIPSNFARKSETILPEISEVDVVRHFTGLSNKNYGVDTGFYPLGSCTMKYNPKINEVTAALPGFTDIHPTASEEQAAGSLELIYELQNMLCEITGMDGFCMHPSAGAHGELLGLMLMKKALEMRGEGHRNVILVPDSAHGTNPASAALCGFETFEIRSAADGGVDLAILREAVGENTAGLMLTNPSTLGLFEKNIEEVAKIVHQAGGLLYYDGANMNANMGEVRPGDMGFDVVHLNLHKTFSTPHGGGGPGSGPVGVKKELIPYLPHPYVTKIDGKCKIDGGRPHSIGRITGWHGNFLVMVRAYTWILTMGGSGLKEASEAAVLNANYVQSILKNYYKLPFDTICKHEFVLSGPKTADGVSTIDVAKRLIDYGYHPPTIYFPLIVEEAIMIEPTESESKATLDVFCDAMIAIAEEIHSTPELLQSAPHHTPVRRIDQVKAAREPILRFTKEGCS